LAVSTAFGFDNTAFEGLGGGLVPCAALAEAGMEEGFEGATGKVCVNVVAGADVPNGSTVMLGGGMDMLKVTIGKVIGSPGIPMDCGGSLASCAV
jgi:hypothetical protein